jgi:hypothetical protein
VPAEVSFDVQPVGANPKRFPDRHAGLHAHRLHLVALGDDAGALVTQDADRHAHQVPAANPLGADVKAIGVEMTDRVLFHGLKFIMYVQIVQGDPTERDDPDVCHAIALTASELSTELIERHGLRRRAHKRAERAEPEYRFYCDDRRPRLPISRDGRLQIVRWGNRRGESKHLPPTGWTWLSTIRDGGWKGSDAVTVKIPASYGLDRGVWYFIEQGVRGLLVPDENGTAVVYVICEPASHYYFIMTRSDRMPVLIEQRI